ncbi:hypothetical protein EGH21_15100 [Halomicroarcula sp. F13]|uniref:Uncharacterized protein n=1 Tax=Haloarcula rubra TaxID=2487747 RepID=A0AAW4PSW2_9EURY|nr:hypothetical protein [Halomicroarcula rubra]MBX0324356.1 hypothetical protein [Halomicroarcula rubra]
MSPTVDELRNEIRREVGRYERVESTAFTKEALAAICEAVGHDIESGRLPPKPEMRATIFDAIDDFDADDVDRADRAFRKGDLTVIADAVRSE